MNIALSPSHGLGDGVLIMVQPSVSDSMFIEVVVESGPEADRTSELRTFVSADKALAHCKAIISSVKQSSPETLIVMDIWPELPLP